MSQQEATKELRCQDCGAQVTAEHLALAKETGQAPYCPDCWSENLIEAEGAALADLKQWEAYINERRAHYHPWGEEPTDVCDECGQRWLRADMGYSPYNGRPICPRCDNILHAER